MTFRKNSQNFLSVNLRARHQMEKDDPNYDPFKDPIIHKRINGIEIVPLNTTKLLGK
jgi:hypothetical protein